MSRTQINMDMPNYSMEVVLLHFEFLTVPTPHRLQQQIAVNRLLIVLKLIK